MCARWVAIAFARAGIAAPGPNRRLSAVVIGRASRPPPKSEIRRPVATHNLGQSACAFCAHHVRIGGTRVGASEDCLSASPAKVNARSHSMNITRSSTPARALHPFIHVPQPFSHSLVITHQFIVKFIALPKPASNNNKFENVC